MAKITVNKDKCKGCMLCVSVCPKAKIKPSGLGPNKKGIKVVEFEDNGECSGCAMCAIICPDTCIEVYKEA